MFTVLLASLLLSDAPATNLDQDRYREVITNALTYLDAGGAELEKDASCLNCHHAPLRNWAVRDALRLGLEVDVQALDDITNSQLTKLAQLKDGYRSQQWGHSLATLYLLGANDDQGQSLPAAVAHDLAQIILSEQTPDGTWKAAQQFANQRRPQRDAHQAQTMWSILALANLPADEEAGQARERAIQWLRSTEPGTTIDSRSLRILVEQRHGKPEVVDQLVAELLQAQHPDGGWGWQPDDPSEAWPVGLALYALGSLEDRTPTEAIAKAQAFLASTQRDDGSWLVGGKLTKNSAMSSYFGTAWAIIGLCRTVPR